MGREERNYTFAKRVRACDFSLKKAVGMFMGGREEQRASERLGIKGQERRSNSNRSRRRREELRWGGGRVSRWRK